MSIISNSDIKTYLGIDSSFTDNDVFINELIQQNQNYIEIFCRQEFEQKSHTINFYGSNQNIFDSKLRLNHSVVNSITSLKYKENLTDSSFTTIISSDYNLININSVYYLVNDAGWEDGNYYELIYDAGFENVPDLIKQILTEMTAVAYLDSNVGEGSKARLGLNSDSENYGNSSLTKSFKDMLPKWEQKLNKYKIWL